MSDHRLRRLAAAAAFGFLPFGLALPGLRVASGGEGLFKRDSGPAKGLARGSGLVCIGRLRARRSEEIVSSRWGVILNRYNHEHRATRRLEQLAATGAKWAKLVPNWDLIEKTKGVYDWNSPDHQLDDLVAGLVKRRITPVFLLFGGNRLYTPHTPPPVPPGVEVLDDPEVKKAWHAYRKKLPGTEVAKIMTDPEVNRAWHAFLEAMARRYHEHVRVWEVWNEPNIGFFWKPHPDAKAYGRMVRQVAEIIKAVDPKATILAGATANVRIAFFRGLLDSEGANSFDFCSVHPYNAVPETRDGVIRQLQDFLASRSKSRVLWQSECSLPSSPDTAGWGGGGPWDETKQAKWLLRRFLSDASLGMAASFFWSLNDCPGPIEQGPKKGGFGVNHKGLHYWGSWEPKPARYALQHLASLIDGRLEPGPVRAAFEMLDTGSFAGARPGTIRTYTLAEKKTGAPAVAYWLPVPMQSEARPATVKLTLATEGVRQPVLVDLLDGRVYQTVASAKRSGATTFDSLPLADYPMVLCRRGLVELAPR